MTLPEGKINGLLILDILGSLSFIHMYKGLTKIVELNAWVNGMKNRMYIFFHEAVNIEVRMFCITNLNSSF